MPKEDPSIEDPSIEDLPREDPPREDPPREDPPKENWREDPLKENLSRDLDNLKSASSVSPYGKSKLKKAKREPTNLRGVFELICPLKGGEVERY